MYESLKRNWQAGKLTAELLQRAVDRGWITAEQANEIAALPAV